MDLLAHDLLGASLWIDVRKAQNPSRRFGQAPLAVWSAFRKAVPLGPGPMAGGATASEEILAAAFVHSTDPAAFYSGAPPPDGTGKTAPAAARCSR